MNFEEMREASHKAADLMRALGSEKRLMLLCQLAQEEKSVGELAEALSLRSSTVSQQLALLRKDGLVKTRREAQTIHYSLAGEAARRVIEVLYEIYCRPRTE